MLKKIKVLGDPNNVPFCSSQIIIDSLNQGLKNVGLYDENGEIVVYDCLSNDHGYKTNHLICAYEVALSRQIINNAKGRKLIGLSLQNQLFFTDAGYPAEKTDNLPLGVDTKIWYPILAKDIPPVFTFAMFADSNTRCDYDSLLIAFSKAFKGRKDIRLFLKDRWATNLLKDYIKALATSLDIWVDHDDTNITDKEQERRIYGDVDCHIFINRSSTFALTVMQAMAMQIPTIVSAYSGPQSYCNELNACIAKHTLENITEYKISELIAKGYRNYLFPPNSNNYPVQPKWAIPDIESLTECLSKVYNDETYRKNIAYQGWVTAKTYTWEKSAARLSAIVAGY